MNKRYLLFTVAFFAIVSCSKEIMERFAGFTKPEGFPEPAYDLSSNNITQSGFELGRKLFYEPRFSRNNTVSCGSCHIQSSAFTQHGHDVSHGIDDRLGRRNSPPIMNLAWMPSFFWDGGVFNLDLQPIVPITNHEEMDETVPNVLAKLRQQPIYPAMFRDAFGDTSITTARTMKALSQFMLMCVSDQSKYDSVVRFRTASFAANEQQGYEVFKQHCASCHAEPLFTDHTFRNNGIATGLNNDRGRAEVTLNPLDAYKFKVPSLRNVQFTAPYMHDGRFINLETVLDHYSSNVQQTPNLDPALNVGGTPGIPLSAQQKSDVIAFLKTLTDYRFLRNPLLSEQ